MTRKSRKRSNKNRGNPSSSNPLLWQKEAISTAMFEYLGVTVLFFTSLIMMICVAFFDKETLSQNLGVFLAELIVFGFFFVLLCFFYLSFYHFFETQKDSVFK